MLSHYTCIDLAFFNTNPYEGLTKEEILDKLAKSCEYAANGMYRDATEISHELRGRYEL